MFKHIVHNANSDISEWDIKQIQPNAVDVRLDRVWIIHGRFTLSDDEKVNAEDKQEYILSGSNDWFLLPKGMYEFQFKGIVRISSDEVGWVIPRSTLVRNGVFLQSGLYDSGYHGSIGAGVYVGGSSFKVKRGTRVGQLLIAKADAVGAYNGSYGIGKAAEKFYDVKP